VGDFRDWLLDDATDGGQARALAPGLTPEMAAAVSKLMRNQDLVLAARKVPRGHRVPQHARAARTPRVPPAAQPPDRRSARHRRLDLDGLIYGCGDAVIGINPATDNLARIVTCCGCSTR
jgi:ethanolamine ammonia-lyase large subunit